MHLALSLVELYNPILKGKERVVSTATDIHPRMELGSKLTNQYASCRYLLATEALHATTLSVAVATVVG